MVIPSLQPPRTPGVGHDLRRHQEAGNKIIIIIIEAHTQPTIQKASLSPISLIPEAVVGTALPRFCSHPLDHRLSSVIVSSADGSESFNVWEAK